ncbi:MAG: sugar phosphate isomerase/epimerase family protein [Actinomycetota bacterium]
MRLACSTASFPEDRVERAIAKAAWAGYDGVELSAVAELPQADEVRERLRLNEIELAGVFGGVLPLGASDDALEGLARVGRAGAFARALDSGSLVIQAPREGSIEQLAATLRLLDSALKNVAVDSCLVNAAGTLLSNPDQFATLWAQGLPERVGIALDPGQALLSGWDPCDLESLPELPRHIYLTDADSNQAVPVGTGRLDLERLGDALRRVGYSGPVVVVLQNADPWAVEPLVKETRELAAGYLNG